MAIRPARAAVHHREPARRQHQYSDRGGCSCTARRLHAAVGGRHERHQRDALRKAQIRFHQGHDASCRHHPIPQRYRGDPIVSGEDHSRVDRPCQGQSGQDQLCVPYRGATPALTDLLGGNVQMTFAPLPASIELVRAGKLRALAVTTAARSEALPEVPALGEFVPGYEASAWNGVVAPKNTPLEIITRLNKENNVGLADPKMKAQFADLGGTVLPGSPADFERLIADEIEKWAKVVKFAGIRPD